MQLVTIECNSAPMTISEPTKRCVRILDRNILANSDSFKLMSKVGRSLYLGGAPQAAQGSGFPLYTPGRLSLNSGGGGGAAAIPRAIRTHLHPCKFRISINEQWMPDKNVKASN